MARLLDLLKLYSIIFYHVVVSSYLNGTFKIYVASLLPYYVVTIDCYVLAHVCQTLLRLLL